MHDTTSPEPLVAILTSLRDEVMGVSESVLSTGDGLLVAADADAVHPESIAALAAATLGLGRRMAEQTKAGSLREVVIRCSGGHVINLAVGDRALLTILGDDGLDLPSLQRALPAAVEQLAKILDADTE
ncbi:roadblock/LC7 domain-containing protein [Streptomyces sp. NPDC005423]|uniref:roadblock/LC7 domain-containing protein n=1 Tax=Streptomyces sp. NPDC005423 TaxID=3155343 RepID=UPI0033A4FA69